MPLKINQKDINIFRLNFVLLILFFLWVQFFIPGFPKIIAKFIFFIAVLVLVSNLFFEGGKMYFSRRFRWYIICIIFFLGLDIYFNGLSINYALNHFSIIAIMLILLDRKNILLPDIEISIIDKIFYFTFLFGILLGILFFHEEIEGTISFTAIGDPNWTGILIFLFFVYSWERKHILGVFITSGYVVLCSASRGLHIMFTLFFLVVLFRKPINYFFKFFLINKIWKLNLLSTIAVILFSFYWLISVAVGPLDAYREGFNDGSNLMRFTANVYAVTQVADNSRLLIAGYDNNLKKEMGIDDSVADDLHTKENGVRLVQPHNACLNLMMKLGLIPAIIEVYMISCLVERLRDEYNFKVILPYLFNAAFLYLYDINYLILWIFVLYISHVSKSAKFEI